MAEKQKTVTVESIRWHTYNGKAYEVGDTYEIDEQLVDSVQTQGMAVRVGRVEVAQKQADAAEASAKASHPVKPITTDDFPAAKTHKK